MHVIDVVDAEKSSVIPFFIIMLISGLHIAFQCYTGNKVDLKIKP